MKIRNGFVSNSSSSSFIIQKEHLSQEQIDKIFAHSDLVTTHENSWMDDTWDITEYKNRIEGRTSMDNFDMYDYLNDVVKVDMNHVKWDD